MSHEKWYPPHNKQRWLNLWARIRAQGNAYEIYDNLIAQYSESHRAYHTLAHIEQCLNELEQTRQLADNPDAVELALWYHDAIYDTKAKDNEEKSAKLLAEVMKDALPNNFIMYVVNLIMATKHTTIPTYPDIKLVVDIDLSILGQPENIFDEYEQQIRKEYEWVPEDAFVAGRSGILKSFLGRLFIYSTGFFRTKYETQARQNIARSLARLQG